MSKLSDLLKNQFDITDSGYPADARALKTLNDRIDSIEPTDINVIDNLTSTSSTDALSAKQGKVLNDKIEATLNGTNYLIVYGTGNPTQNAAELQAAYDSVTSGTDRFTIIVAPGHYAGTFNITKEKVDIVSLTGNPDVMLDGINVTANNVYLKGLNCGSNSFAVTGVGINDGIFENCIGGDNSFGGEGSGFYGKAINCKAGNNSFGGSSGDFFAYATAYNCVAGDNSFGGGDYGGYFMGYAENCKAGLNSFATNGNFSGICVNCSGGANSFGQGGLFSNLGRANYCRLTSGNWSSITPETGGHISFCINGNGSAAANV